MSTFRKAIASIGTFLLVVLAVLKTAPAKTYIYFIGLVFVFTGLAQFSPALALSLVGALLILDAYHNPPPSGPSRR